MTGLRVTTRHIFTIPGFSRRQGFCRGQSKKWFQAHGLDWREFVRNGIEIERLEAIDDVFAQATVKWTRECEAEATNGRR